MNKDSLGDRMKGYETRAFRMLVPKIPILLRIDGKAFHNWTAGLERPFDANLKFCMDYAMLKLCHDIEGARFGYCQSDEISILICDYQDIYTEGWFDYRANKIESVSASICTGAFIHASIHRLLAQFNKKGPAVFDARAWNLPREEVANYFIWRQRDCEKNSVSQLAMAHFSHNELTKKNGSQKQDMLVLEKGINWNDLDTNYKRGSAAFKVQEQVKGSLRSKWVLDYTMPIISKEREYVERWVESAPTLMDRYYKADLKDLNTFL